MIISDLAKIEGHRFPAGRRTQNLVNGAAPIQCRNFAMGNVTLDPNGGQVPWHNQEQEEVYFIVEGTAEMCLGEERQTLTTGQAVYIPSGVFHQLTNIGDTPLRMIYVYGPAGDVAALTALVAMVPLAAGLIVGAGSSVKLVARIGTTNVVASGLAALGAILASSLLWTPDIPYWPLGLWFFGAAVAMGGRISAGRQR